MRAAVFKEMGKPLAVETIAKPECGPNDLILKVKTCGICGSDLHMTEPTSIMPLPSGAVMGHEFAGEVVEIGSALKGRWKAGDRVAGFPYLCCGEHVPCLNIGIGGGMCAKGKGIGLGQSHGAYAEFVRISSSGAHPLPQSVSWQEGAMVEPLAVGLHAVDMGRMNRGDTVLVIGAGPVGLAGKGPDLIFECVGVPGLINETMMMAPRGAKIVIAGVCQSPDTIMPLVGIMKELNLQFVLGYRPADFDYVIEMIAKDRVDVSQMVTDTITLDQLPAAFEALRKPTHQCKVMLVN